MTNDRARKVLVIDDEATQRMLVKEYLEEAGYVVRLAEDGKHGMRLAASLAPDLILLDALLPSVDGYRVCMELRRQAKTAQIPIILITASKESDAIAKGLAAGATDFITKPVDFQFLADRVAFVLQHAKQANENCQVLATTPGFDELLKLAEERGRADAELAMQKARDAEIAKIQAEADLKVQAIVQSAEEAIRANNEHHQQRIAEFKIKPSSQDNALPIRKGDTVDNSVGATGLVSDDGYWRMTKMLSSEYLGHLEAIKSLTEQLSGETPKSGQSEAFNAIISTVNTAGRSINNLRLLSALLSGEDQLQTNSANLQTLLEACAASARSICATRAIMLEVDIDPELPAVKGSELHLRYMLLALVSNALRFSPPGSTIRIEAGVLPDHTISIEISDQGVGMAGPVLNRIRNALRPGNMLSGSGSAIGFGVPIATAIARLHGGQIKFDSAVGGGTKATVVLSALEGRILCEPMVLGAA